MKKLLIATIALLATSTCLASDYQEVQTKQVQVTNASYKPCTQKQLAPTYTYKLQPVTVYTGKTVTVQKHYEVYQPKVVYEKVNSYTTTKTCEYCK